MNSASSATIILVCMDSPKGNEGTLPATPIVLRSNVQRTQFNAAPVSNHCLITLRSASVMPVALFMGMTLVTTACW
jgi:hypothetical protein